MRDQLKTQNIYLKKHIKTRISKEAINEKQLQLYKIIENESNICIRNQREVQRKLLKLSIKGKENYRVLVQKKKSNYKQASIDLMKAKQDIESEKINMMTRERELNQVKRQINQYKQTIKNLKQERTLLMCPFNKEIQFQV